MPTNDVIARLIPEQGIRAEIDTLYLYNPLDMQLAKVAHTGSYLDLIDKPAIPGPQVNADWDATSGLAKILNKPVLATVATTGAYSDLSGTPSLATVATTGSYNDLSNKPSIPSAQVNADWNADSGVAEILNKPTIPTVNDSTITITQGGVTKGSFSLNQTSGDTIDVDAGVTYTAGSGISITNNEISATDPVLVNNAQTSTSISVKGSIGDAGNSVAIGDGAQRTAFAGYLVCIGAKTKASTNGVAIGYNAKATVVAAIQIGQGTNSSYDTFMVGNRNGNYEIMSADGTIPLARFTTVPAAAGSYAATITIDAQSNVTRSWSSLATVATTGDYDDLINKPTIPDTTDMQVTTNLVTSVSSSSTDTQYPSAKLFYDTCGDIEALINAL